MKHLLSTRSVLAGTLLYAMTMIPSAHAASFAMDIAPLLWRYQEQMPLITGFSMATPLSSSVSGSGWLARGSVHIPLAGERMQLLLGGEWLTSIGHHQELWHTGGNIQQNQLTVTQRQWFAEARLQLSEISPLLYVGLSAAMQQDRQTRSRFYVNGALSAAVGSAVETIDSTWLDLSLNGTTPATAFRLRLAAGVPLRDRMQNTVVSGAVFHSQQQAWRLRVEADYPLPVVGGNTRLSAFYRFRQLGNDVQTSSLWPKNRWQVYGLGIHQQW